MSQDSVTSEVFDAEIQEYIDASDKLLEFSKQPGTLILPETEHSPTSQMDPWNADEVMFLDENIIYHKKMVALLDQVKATGPVNKIPSPPKRKLRDLFNEKLGKKRKQDPGMMTPEGLHSHLKQHLVDLNLQISRKMFIFGAPPNIEAAVEQLKDAYRHLNRQNAQSMMMNISFGQFLNHFYNWFIEQKQAGAFNISWATWLMGLIPISASHARKLRQLAKLLSGYPVFQHLDLPLSEILSRSALIKEMLTLEQCAAFWKHPTEIPSEAQVQSQ